ncbi:MAG: hypothetical protein QW161_01170 [Candidatus Bathyarchaeia archaeon]
MGGPNIKKQKRGQVRIIEAFLAVLIVFSSLAISASLTTEQKTTESNNLASIGIQALIKLDSDGSLGAYIDQGNWSGLREALSLLLPEGISFNLTVYDEEMQQINTEAVTNGNIDSQEVASIKYVCVSQNPSFRYYVIYLRLAVVK